MTLSFLSLFRYLLCRHVRCRGEVARSLTVR